MRPRYIIFISFLFLICGCAKDPSFPPCEQLLISGSADASALIGTWELKSMSVLGIEDSEVQPDQSFRTMSLSFLHNSTCDIVGPCNTISERQYKLTAKNHLEFDFENMANDFLGCGPEEIVEWEDEYFNAIINTMCYAIDKSGRLKIHFENDSQYNVMTFSKL